MAESGAQRRYRDDESALVAIGRALGHVELPTVQVRIPRLLAEQAVAAWDRDENEPVAEESLEQRIHRHRAGVLALIGLTIAQRGRWLDNEVVVDLGSALVAGATDAADGR